MWVDQLLNTWVDAIAEQRTLYLILFVSTTIVSQHHHVRNWDMLTAMLDAPAMGRPRVVRHPVRAAPPHTPLLIYRFCFAMLLGGDVLLFSVPLDIHDLVVLRHSKHRGTYIPHSYARHGHRMS